MLVPPSPQRQIRRVLIGYQGAVEYSLQWWREIARSSSSFASALFGRPVPAGFRAAEFLRRAEPAPTRIAIGSRETPIIPGPNSSGLSRTERM